MRMFFLALLAASVLLVSGLDAGATRKPLARYQKFEFKFMVGPLDEGSQAVVRGTRENGPYEIDVNFNGRVYPIPAEIVQKLPSYPSGLEFADGGNRPDLGRSMLLRFSSNVFAVEFFNQPSDYDSTSTAIVRISEKKGVELITTDVR